jgi:hypothetical protein
MPSEFVQGVSSLSNSKGDGGKWQAGVDRVVAADRDHHE